MTKEELLVFKQDEVSKYRWPGHAAAQAAEGYGTIEIAFDAAIEHFDDAPETMLESIVTALKECEFTTDTVIAYNATHVFMRMICLKDYPDIGFEIAQNTTGSVRRTLEHNPLLKTAIEKKIYDISLKMLHEPRVKTPAERAAAAAAFMPENKPE